MTINSVAGVRPLHRIQILNRSQLDSLTEQLASGRISTTYAGDGSGAASAIGIRAQLRQLCPATPTPRPSAEHARHTVATTCRCSGFRYRYWKQKRRSRQRRHHARRYRADAPPENGPVGLYRLTVSMLNAQSGDRFLFSGRATDTAPVAPLGPDHEWKRRSHRRVEAGDFFSASAHGPISEPMARDGSRSRQAPLQHRFKSAKTMPRPPPALPQPFGLKLSAVSTAIAGATVTQPVTPPVTVPPTPAAQRSVSVDLGTTNPNPGDRSQALPSSCPTGPPRTS